MSTLERPRAIGDYEIVEELGRGSFGVVYAARRRGLDRLFAVKVLLDPGLRDAEIQKRFEIEARVASRIEDPGVVGVIDIGRDSSGRPYYVMPHCKGETLHAVLRAGPLELGRAVELAAELGRILSLLHEQGVIHRDFKPANIIIDEATSKPRVTDFGLARDQLKQSALTRTGDVIGTPLYMSPEQMRGERVTHRADIYALGLILYECLTGVRPHQAPTVAEMTRKVANDLVPPPSRLRPGIPASIDAICLRALSKSVGARQASGLEVARDLLAALRAERNGSKDTGPGARKVLVAVSLVLAVLGVVAVALVARSRSVPVTPPAPPPPPVLKVPAPPPPPPPPPQQPRLVLRPELADEVDRVADDVILERVRKGWLLKTGRSGSGVAAYQRALNKLGWKVEVNGVYDEATLAATKEFQRSADIAVDGDVGRQTMGALDRLLARPLSDQRLGFIDVDDAPLPVREAARSALADRTGIGAKAPFEAGGERYVARREPAPPGQIEPDLTIVRVQDPW